MSRVIVAPEALTDIANITDYLTDVASPAVAERWSNKLLSALERLELFPGSGAPRPRLGPSVRIVIVPPYIAIYEHDPGSEDVVILRIVHGRRNMTRHLLRWPDNS